MVCPLLVNQNELVTRKLPVYDDLFEDDVLKQRRAAAIIFENFRKRKKKSS